MNYELKYIRPGSLFLNSLRIMSVVGFIVGVATFLIPNSTVALWSVTQRLVGTLVFTLVYGPVAATVLMGLGWLYNFWAKSFRGVRVTLEQEEE